MPSSIASDQTYGIRRQNVESLFHLEHALFQITSACTAYSTPRNRVGDCALYSQKKKRFEKKKRSCQSRCCAINWCGLCRQRRRWRSGILLHAPRQILIQNRRERCDCVATASCRRGALRRDRAVPDGTGLLLKLLRLTWNRGLRRRGQPTRWRRAEIGHGATRKW